MSTKKLTFAELKKLSLQELKAVPLEHLLELSDEQWDELLQNEEMSLHYQWVGGGNSIYAQGGRGRGCIYYGCDTTSGIASC